MTISRIEHVDGAVIHSGRAAVEVFRARASIAALKLLRNGITPSRGVTMTRVLQTASQITGHTYKRTESTQALIDLADFVARETENLTR